MRNGSPRTGVSFCAGTLSAMAVFKRKYRGGKTVWCFVIDAPGSTREIRHQIKESGFSTKAAAEHAEAERRITEQQKYELQKAGLPDVPLPKTLGDLLRDFFAEHAEKKLAKKTIERYREQAAYLQADLLAMPVCEIKPLHLAKEWNRLLEPEAAPIEITQEAESPVEDVPTQPEATPAEAESGASLEANVPAPVAGQAAHVATVGAPAANDATPAPDAPVPAPDEKLLRSLVRAFEGLSPELAEAKWEALKSALAARKTTAPRTTAKAEATREGSKTSQVIAMLKREGGVTLEEIMQTMAWQKHTTRAMLSAGGSLVKKHGLVIVSEKVGENRVYSIKA